MQPGPRLLESNLSLVFVLIWSLALANILATAICLILARPIARLTLIPFNLAFPVLFFMVVLGSYQATRHIGDLIALIGFGILGWVMKRVGMARPPLLIGFILAPLIERDLWITTSRYGLEWLLRPGVLSLGGLVLLLIGFKNRHRLLGVFTK